MKKPLIAAALVASLSLVAVACDNDDATPEPTSPAEAVESMVAEEVTEAVETMEAVEEAVESMAAEEVTEAEEAVEEATEDE